MPTKTAKAKPQKTVKAKLPEFGTAAEAGLTKAQLQRLDRDFADLADPVRYVINSSILGDAKLYYAVDEDAYLFNNLKGATLFKRRKAAQAVVDFLVARAKPTSGKPTYRIERVTKPMPVPMPKRR